MMIVDIGNLTIIGTSHIAQQSVKEVTSTMEDRRPFIVALELDTKRFQGLISGYEGRPEWRHIKYIGIKGYLFAELLYWAQKKMGDMVGMKPGADMRAGIAYAHTHKLKVALIDQPIEKTLKRLSHLLTWNEKFRFVLDGITSLLGLETPLTFDLKTVPSDDLINELLERVRVRYPNLYKALISERNVVMATKLVRIVKDHPDKKIVAVIGAGHVKELVELFNEKMVVKMFSFGHETFAE